MHYIRFYFASIKRSIMSRLEYKGDTIIAMLAFTIENVCSLLSIYFVVNSIPALNIDGQGVWNIWQIGFLYGFVMLPKGVDHLFTDELWRVCYWRVTDGSLDRNFLKPMPTLLMTIAETFQPEGFGEIILGIAMIIICGLQPNVVFNWTFANVVLLIIAIIFGAIIISAFKIMFAGLAFILKRTGQMFQLVYNSLTYVKYPRGIFPKFIRVLLTGIIPFMLITTIPVEILLGFLSYNPWIISIIIISAAAILLTLSIIIWNVCASKYESTGN